MFNTKTYKNYLSAFNNYWKWVFQEYFNKDCPTAAASLTLTSLFAFVPLFLIIINILNTFDVFNHLSTRIQSFLFENMLPSTAVAVQGYIITLSKKMASLPIASILFLLTVIFFMIKNLETNLNKIFYVNKPRPLLQSMLVYWALMTIGPVFFGFVFISSSYLISMSWVSSDIGTEQYLINFISYLFLVIAFFIIYRILPNTRISSKSALITSFFVSLVFVIAKKIFTLYMVNVPTYSVIYGSLSLIPIFILWIFICWHITLVGAVMLKGLQLVKINLKFSETSKRDYLTIAVSIIKDLHINQKNLSNGSTMRGVYSNVGAHNFDMVKEIIYKLETSNIIRVTTDNVCYLNCDVYSLKLRDIYNCFDSIVNAKMSSSKKINSIKTNLYNDLNISVYECF